MPPKSLSLICLAISSVASKFTSNAVCSNFPLPIYLPEFTSTVINASVESIVINPPEQSQNYETLYNQWKLKFDNIVERYNKGKEVCEQQEKNAKDNWPNELKELERNIQEKKDEIESLSRNEKELKSNINESQKQLEYIENRIKYYESELDSILDKYNTVQ